MYNADFDGDEENIINPTYMPTTFTNPDRERVTASDLERYTQMTLDSFHQTGFRNKSEVLDLNSLFTSKPARYTGYDRYETPEGQSVGLLGSRGLFANHMKSLKEKEKERQKEREKYHTTTYSKESLKICINEKIGFNEVIDVEDECSICLEDIDFGVEVSCGHQYCYKCTSDIIDKCTGVFYGTSCPYCRQIINWNKYKLFKSEEQHKRELEKAEKERLRKEKEAKIKKAINDRIAELELEQKKMVKKEKITMSLEKEMQKRAWKNKKR